MRPILRPSPLKNSNRFRSSFGAVVCFAEPCDAMMLVHLMAFRSTQVHTSLGQSLLHFQREKTKKKYPE